MKPSLCYRLWYPALILPTLLLGAMAGCVSSRQPNHALRTASAAQSGYAGSEACAPCHVAESEGFAQTNHARTFRPMTPVALGVQTPPAGPLPDTDCILETANDRYAVRVASTGETKTLDYALGSGKSGMTYITIEHKTDLVEMRRSYFPASHRWFITPGQEAQEKDLAHIGRNHGNLRACVLCHAVTLPDDSLHPEPKFMGVGCEACHGPCRAHIAAAEHGELNPSPENLQSANGERINMLCGRCHRTVEDVLAKPAPEQRTDRFPVYGLASSRCFQASGGKLTCITCHNPHQNARTDPRFYEAICLQCHTSPSAPASSATRVRGSPARFRVQAKVCPINPRTGCIGCHMPRRKVFADTSLPTAMADHFIKIHHN